MYNLWIGLRCLGVSRYWGNSIYKYVAKPQLLKWMNKWVFNDSNNCLMICENCFHPASRQKYGTDFSLSEAYHDFISHLLKLSRNYGRHTKLKPQKTNNSLLTGMPWLAIFRARPWWMLGGMPRCITVWGVHAYASVPKSVIASSGQPRPSSG